ncbi:hypothetical protein L1049_024386 [Liquidambar formosana]|uniref:F-box domain-containing protein n=1 Tax=Liquidambar formosana TaxID=63359 RepID=A0AAP0RUD6_LIQFO
MKRSKKSIMHIQGKNKRVAAEEVHDEDQQPSPSIKDLPTHILIEILSRLSVRTIVRCRCVCKTWLNLLLTSLFAKHHFTRAPTCPLLQNPNGKRLSRTLCLLELEGDSTFNGNGSCGFIGCSRNGYQVNCERHVNMKLAPKFNMPKLDGAKKMMPKSSRSLGLKLDVVNSCNGLLCLRGPSCDDPVVIYNPITGEYMTIPTPEKDNCVEKAVVCGLGFSPKSGQYKVLRMLYFRCPAVGKRLFVQVAEIHTVGSGEWRRIGSSSYSPFGRSFPAYLSLRGTSFPAFLNGALHWFCEDDESPNFIVSFDFEDEQFRAIPPPLPYLYDGYSRVGTIKFRCFRSNKSKISMGVLKGSLYLCDASSYDPIDIWVMKDYGVRESWFKEFEIDTLNRDRWPAGLYQPIDFLKNGDLLMYHASNAFISYHVNGLYHGFKYFKIRNIQSKFLAIPHIPSFVSLKGMMGNNVEVLNARSRFAKIELKKGTIDALFLAEVDRDMISDSDRSSSDDESPL